MSPTTILMVGFLLGLKHALEPDHIVAVSAIAAEEKSILRSVAVGAWWGAGHALTLMLAGLVVIALKVRIPSSYTPIVECLVGVLLVVLGLNLLRKITRDRLHLHPHSHEGHRHVHFHRHADRPDHLHAHGIEIGWRAIVAGMIQGFAGSAGLMLLVLSTVPEARLALAFILVFSLGSIGAMTAVTVTLGTLFAAVPPGLSALDRGLRISVGAASAGFGLWIAVSASRMI